MRVVVIGNGMAGARVAAEVHARSDDAKVTVLGAEPHPAYNRILLSSVLAGKVDEPTWRCTEPPPTASTCASACRSPRSTGRPAGRPLRNGEADRVRPAGAGHRQPGPGPAAARA